ncbi:P-loop containing nucleoside triphosphate hydrolase protein [Xylariales sp. PMI_506]|nr:P-loop containing nucleoside triphosphate hydrolase protein [Xylariales sp. PMI_506]
MAACDFQADDVFGPQVVSCREGFDFTLLFEQAILSALPSGLVIIASIGYSLYLSRQDIKTKPDASWMLRALKQILIVGFASTQLALIVLWTQPPSRPTRLSLPSSVLSFIAGLALAFLSNLEHSRSIRPSAIINVYLAFSILFDIAQSRTLWLRGSDFAVAAVFTAGVSLKVLTLVAEIAQKRRLLKGPYSQYPPEALSGVLNRSVFWWINSLLIKGSSTRLTLDDLFGLDDKMTSEHVGPMFRSLWQSRQRTSRNTLLWITLRCFWRPILAIVVFRLGLIGFKFCQPLLINKAVTLLLEPDSQYKTNTGRALIGAAALIYLGIAITTALYKHSIYRLITMTRGAMIDLLYDTTLELDTQDTRASAAITLMSTDIDRIASGFEVFDSVWADPIEIVLAMYLLYNQVGVSFIAPILVSLVFVSITLALRRVSSSAQKEWIESIQTRVATTASTLSHMKGIKMTGLSECVEKELQSLRVRELEVSGKFRNILATSLTIATMSNAAIPVITLVTYAMVARATEDKYLNQVLAFTVLSLVALLATPIQDLTKSLPHIAAAAGCFQRIQAYVHGSVESKSSTEATYQLSSSSSETVDESSSTDDTQNAPDVEMREKKDILLEMRNARFTLSTPGDPLLSDISLTISPGTWTVVIGPIGSGKSMLLSSLLGELRQDGGSVYRRPLLGVGYCAQDPWLPNLSIQKLILGFDDLDVAWYSTVLDACALRPDLEELPLGDRTVIGSNGVSLSGGQKQRLSLARAIYSRKPLLILDDVLGGLDAKTEQIIVTKVFGNTGILRALGIAVFLATHSDHVIIMKEGGRIMEQGPPDQVEALRQSDLNPPPKAEHSTSASASEPSETSSPSQQEVPIEDTAEDKAQDFPTGDIRLYLYYMEAIGWANTFGLIFLTGTFSLFLKVPSVLVQRWTNAESEEPGVYTNLYAGLYGLFCGLCLLSFSAGFFLLFHYGIPRSSINLHERLLRALLQAPYWFFVSTDSGQILNRFSQDMTLLCLQLPFALDDTLFNAGVCIVGAVLITLASKWVTLVYPVLLPTLYVLQKFYLRTSRQMRLLDLEAKSPLYAYFLQTLQGVTTIRAFGWQNSSARENTKLLEQSQRPFYLMWSIQRWLNLVLDLLVAAIATLVVALATQLKGSSAGALGVSLVSILTFSQDLTYLIRTWTDLETSLGAIARVRSFEKDTPRENLPDENIKPSEVWPSEGKIDIKQMCSAYRTSAKPILENISLDICPGSKIGICGRTGSGKSTFALTLLRLAEIQSGDVSVDGIPLSEIHRDTVRRRVITLPQDPLLLPGTVRFNADPFSEHTDEAIISALQEVGIADVVTARGGLDVHLDAVPLSRGQQQLFCLTRAILNSSRVVILDEMTSSVDAATEAKMMEVVDKRFNHCTVIAITHHLHTVRHFDQIVVLDQGHIMETGSPDELLQRASVFRELWDHQQ